MQIPKMLIATIAVIKNIVKTEVHAHFCVYRTVDRV